MESLARWLRRRRSCPTSRMRCRHHNMLNTLPERCQHILKTGVFAGAEVLKLEDAEVPTRADLKSNKHLKKHCCAHELSNSSAPP